MTRRSMQLALTAVLALGLTSACKTQGVAVTERAQVMTINIRGANDLPENFTDKVRVEVGNRGVNNLHDVEFTVEFPDELVVLSESHGRGMDLMILETPAGRKYYHYRIGNLNVAETSKAEFEIRTNFGTLSRSSDIKVTAWQTDLPSNKLVETKRIELRR